MKIALAFFGLPRGTALTWPAIERHLVAPLAAAGDLSVRYHLWRQPWIRNPRSREDHPQDEANYRPFLAHVGALQQRPPQAPEPFDRLRPRGDAWQDGFHSLANLVLQLHSLMAVTEQLVAVQPDVVVFARPDLLYHAALPRDHVARVQADPDAILLPEWECWGGFNDRFAICGARAWRAYGGRLLLADHFCERTGRPMHAETFLRYALGFAGVSVGTIGLRASRVRVDGRIEAEDFEGRLSPLVRTGRPGR